MKKVLSSFLLLLSISALCQSRLDFFNFNVPYEEWINVNFNNHLFNQKAMKDSSFRTVIVQARIISKSKFLISESWEHCKLYFDTTGIPFKRIDEGDVTILLNKPKGLISEIPFHTDSIVIISENDTVISWYEIMFNLDTLSTNYYKFDNQKNLIEVSKKYNKKLNPYYEYKVNIDEKFYYNNNNLTGFQKGDGYEYLFINKKNGLLIIKREIDSNKQKCYAQIIQKRRFNKDIIVIKSLEEPKKRKFKIYLDRKDKRIIRKIKTCYRKYENVCYEFDYEK
jgi:hypothetical protein